MKGIIIAIKGIIITVFAVILFFVILLILDKTILRHTPESVLKATFGISLKNFDYSIETFDEQWSPNGDGQVLVIYKFNSLTQDNILYLKKNGLKPLPILMEDYNNMVFNKLTEEYLKIDTGYYIYERLSTVDFKRNYQVFVVDTKKRIAILYYQYM